MAYATISEVRALDDLSDTTSYPDSVIQDGIDNATVTIDGYTGAAWESKPFQVTVELRNRLDDYLRQGYGFPVYPDVSTWEKLIVPVLFIRTLTSVTIDGVTQDATGWVTFDHGEIRRTDGGIFDGYQATIAGTAGVTFCHRCRVLCPCPPIKWATKTLAAQYVKDLNSRIPDRAIQVQSEFGSMQLAQAGGQGRPTSLPDVNAVLNRHLHVPPALG